MGVLPLAERPASPEHRRCEGGPIRAIEAHVTRDQAVRAFADGLAGRARCLARGPLRAVADVYVPFRFYRVASGRERASLIVGIDAVTGALDLYRFDAVNDSARIVSVRTRNCIDPLLSSEAAADVLDARMKRLTYQRLGFLAGGRVRLEIESLEADLHVPYWAGFFGRGESASLVVMDAVRRQIEGVKVRRLIGDWLQRR